MCMTLTVIGLNIILKIRNFAGLFFVMNFTKVYGNTILKLEQKLYDCNITLNKQQKQLEKMEELLNKKC